MPGVGSLEGVKAFLVDHIADLRRLARKYAPPGHAEDVVNEVVLKAPADTLGRKLAKGQKAEALKYISKMVHHESVNAWRREKNQKPRVSEVGPVAPFDAAEIRDDVRARLKNPERVLEVAARFIRMLPAVFGWDLCPHDWMEPRPGLLPAKRINELMKRELELSKLLLRLSGGSSRWRMTKAHVSLLSGRLEDSDLAVALLTTLREDVARQAPGDWGGDALGQAIERYLMAPARSLLNSELRTLLEVRDKCVFKGLVEEGIDPVGRALRHAAVLHGALQKSVIGERRSLVPPERSALHCASMEAYTVHLFWSQCLPRAEFEAAFRRAVPDEVARTLEEGSREWMDQDGQERGVGAQ